MEGSGINLPHAAPALLQCGTAPSQTDSLISTFLLVIAGQYGPAGPADIGELELADAPLVLVIGAEGRGLSRLIAQRCDAVARIPITGAESLNASVAAGIALYAVARRRG